MTQVDLTQLIGKLNDTSRRALEGAAGLCNSRTNYNVEVEHWLVKLLEQNNTDLSSILKHFGVEESRLVADLTVAIDRLKTGNAGRQVLSPSVIDLVQAAWLLGSVDFGASAARSGHIVYALLSEKSLAHVVRSLSAEFDKISPETLLRSFTDITRNSEENAQVATAPAGTARPGAPGRPVGPTKTPALDQYTIDLTARAKAGDIDPVLGRDSEIRQIIDILMRRRQNNPILTGEAGVGKTAVVEGFALRLVAEDVPPAMQNVSIRSLDMGLLQAGAGVKGEFENRLKSVIAEVKASPTPIILFIDEAHTLIGAGGGGQNDAANLLKPALARGELRTVAATTWAEYKKYFEKDAAMARRFQVVKVEEPDEDSAVQMMRGLTETLESHHQVRILNEAVVDAVKLSSRYISGRQLPDKSVSLLDTTCARIALSQSSTPPAIEDLQRSIQQFAVAIRILEREMESGGDHAAQLEELETNRAATEKQLEAFKEQWETEKAHVNRIKEIHVQLDGNEVAEPGKKGADEKQKKVVLTDEDRERLKTELAQTEQELLKVQGKSPLVHPCVNGSAIAETVAAWTGIPVGRMVADEIHTVLNLKSLMEESIIGQSHALERITQSIRTSRANLSDPRTPIGVFLLAGTSGVGKTETAITLAELLYGGEQNMTVLNMSEFKEEHKVSLLMGSPPGYVGYGEGGVLTEAVRRKPYSVVLLDEMEKAHPGVQDVFYQVFDKGNMKDGEGRDIDFRNTVILMTTNAGTDLIKSLCADPETAPDPDDFLEAIFPELLKTFKPAFLGRTTIIPFYPLNDEVMRMIIKLKLGKVSKRIREHYQAKFSYNDDLVDAIAERCTEVDTGARNVDHILTRTLLPEMSTEFLSRLAEGGEINQVELSVGDDGQFQYAIT